MRGLESSNSTPDDKNTMYQIRNFDLLVCRGGLQQTRESLRLNALDSLVFMFIATPWSQFCVR